MLRETINQEKNKGNLTPKCNKNTQCNSPQKRSQKRSDNLHAQNPPRNTTKSKNENSKRKEKMPINQM